MTTLSRRAFLAGAMTLSATAEAMAQSAQASVLRQLRAQGYRNIVVTRTLLGRLRFVAERNGVRREIILNPQNGAILRDYSQVIGGEGPGPIIAGGGGAGGGSGPEGDENDDNEDAGGDDAGDDDDEGDD